MTAVADSVPVQATGAGVRACDVMRALPGRPTVAVAAAGVTEPGHAAGLKRSGNRRQAVLTGHDSSQKNMVPAHLCTFGCFFKKFSSVDKESWVN